MKFYIGRRVPTGRTALGSGEPITTAVVEVHEEDQGEHLKPGKPLKHFMRHSPDGFEWGYGGSGPAELARCMLIDALGAKAFCKTCRGGGRVVFVTQGTDVHVRTPGSHDHPETISSCPACDGGIIPLPYQTFKFEVISGLDRMAFSLTDREVIEWYDNHEAATKAEAKR